jgi:hypothetical protein
MTEETASSSDIMEDLDNLTDQLSQVRTRLGMARLEANTQLQRTSSDEEARARSLGSSSSSVARTKRKQPSRKQPSLLSPVARMQLNQLQEEVAQAQNQRVLAKIGQLYLDQNRKEQLTMDDDNSDKERDDDTSEDDGQVIASMASEVSPFRGGSGPLNLSPKDNFYHGSTHLTIEVATLFLFLRIGFIFMTNSRPPLGKQYLGCYHHLRMMFAMTQ